MIVINANIITAANQNYDNGYIRVKNGKITEIGEMSGKLKLMEDETVYDAKGMLVLPGFIDIHTHLGMCEDALGFEGDDINEDADPSTPHLRAIDAINPYDRCFADALSAGITTVVTGPGSANAIGGQMVAIKTRSKRVDDMIVKAPVSIKFAFGENPKTVYNEKHQSPITRMATAGIMREQLFKAKKYMQDMQKAQIDDEVDEPEFDIKCEALIPLLKKEVKAHIHAHRADDIFTAIRIAKEFDIDIVIIHATEGYLIADDLQKENISVVSGPFLCDRSKPELRNLDPKSPGIMSAKGIPTSICTDHPVIPIQYLPICAGLAVREGMDYGLALSALTITAAEIAGIDDRVGSIEVGKDADFALYDNDPFSVYTKPVMVFVDGELVQKGEIAKAEDKNVK